MRDTHVASSVVDVLRIATDGGARELLRVVLGEAPGAAGGCAVVGAVDGARELPTSLAMLKMILFTQLSQQTVTSASSVRLPWDPVLRDCLCAISGPGLCDGADYTYIHTVCTAGRSANAPRSARLRGYPLCQERPSASGSEGAWADPLKACAAKPASLGAAASEAAGTL